MTQLPPIRVHRCSSVVHFRMLLPSLLLTGALVAGCHGRGGRPRGETGAPPAKPGAAPAGKVFWDLRVPEYRRTLLQGGVSACFRNDRVTGREAATGRRLWEVQGALEGHAAADAERWFL